MSEKNPVLLLDTNIWLDLYLEYRPGHEVAKALMDFADDANMTKAYASVSSKDAFYVICGEMKRLAREEKGSLSQADALAAQSVAWGCVRNMIQNAVAVPVGEPQVWLASHYEDPHDDFEDDLVLAALETSKADFFVTNDEVLRGKAPTGAFDAADMLAYLRMRDEAAV